MSASAAFAVLYLWLKLILYWLKLFETTSKFVQLISTTLIDIVLFSTIFFMILFGFANAVYIMNILRVEDKQLYKE